MLLRVLLALLAALGAAVSSDGAAAVAAEGAAAAVAGAPSAAVLSRRCEPFFDVLQRTLEEARGRRRPNAQRAAHRRWPARDVPAPTRSPRR